jgi:chitin disaccharide deacetylase
MMGGAKYLAVNADDFGFTRDVNAGIVEAHERGILTSTTLMANGVEFDDAVRLAREHPTLDVGVHFVLVSGQSLLDPTRAFPLTVSGLMKAMALRRIRVYDELRAQMVKVVEAGLQPTHVDTHKHTHLLPPVLDAVARLSEEFGVRWVRRPFDLPLTGSPDDVPWKTRAVSRAFGFVRGHFHRALASHHCATTDWFAGFQITGRFGPQSVVHLLDHLPEGTTEFMVHPGFCTAELRAARTRLKESREQELRALLHPDVREAVRRNAIQLTGYGRMPR